MDTTFNYLSPIDKWDTVKPYEIAGRVRSGLPRNNLEFTSYSASVSDARHGEVPSLATTGFEWVNHDTPESLDNEESISKHVKEMELFLKEYLRADQVLTFQYQVLSIGLYLYGLLSYQRSDQKTKARASRSNHQASKQFCSYW